MQAPTDERDREIQCPKSHCQAKFYVPDVLHIGTVFQGCQKNTHKQKKETGIRHFVKQIPFKKLYDDCNVKNAENIVFVQRSRRISHGRGHDNGRKKEFFHFLFIDIDKFFNEAGSIDIDSKDAGRLQLLFNECQDKLIPIILVGDLVGKNKNGRENKEGRWKKVVEKIAEATPYQHPTDIRRYSHQYENYVGLVLDENFLEDQKHTKEKKKQHMKEVTSFLIY